MDTKKPPLTQVLLEKPIWDLVKLFLAFLVVGIHTYPKTSNPVLNFYIRDWLGRFAVPIFLVIAGYFLFQRTSKSDLLNSNDSIIVKNYYKRILWMYIIWSAVYLPFQIVEWIKDGNIKYSILVYIESFLIRGDSYLQLWYLGALFMAVFLIWLLNRFFSMKKIFAISLILYAFGLIWSPYNFLVNSFVEKSSILTLFQTNLNRFLGWPRNGTFFALVFVVMGALIAQNDLKIPTKLSLPLAIAFMGGSAAEVWLLRSKNDPYNTTIQISLVFTVFFVFMFLNSIELKSKPLYRKLRKCSTIIYLIHPLIMMFLKSFSCIKHLLSLPFVEWILVYIITFSISYLIVSIKNKRVKKIIKIFT